MASTTMPTMPTTTLEDCIESWYYLDYKQKRLQKKLNKKKKKSKKKGGFFGRFRRQNTSPDDSDSNFVNDDSNNKNNGNNGSSSSSPPGLIMSASERSNGVASSISSSGRSSSSSNAMLLDSLPSLRQRLDLMLDVAKSIQELYHSNNDIPLTGSDFPLQPNTIAISILSKETTATAAEITQELPPKMKAELLSSSLGEEEPRQNKKVQVNQFYQPPEDGLKKVDGSATTETTATAASDIYSLGLLIYYVSTLHAPYEEYTNNMIFDGIMGTNDQHTTFQNHCWKYGERPICNEFDTLPKDLIKLIVVCWSQDISKRPTISNVITRLEELIWKMYLSTNVREWMQGNVDDDDER